MTKTAASQLIAYLEDVRKEFAGTSETVQRWIDEARSGQLPDNEEDRSHGDNEPTKKGPTYLTDRWGHLSVINLIRVAEYFQDSYVAMAARWESLRESKTLDRDTFNGLVERCPLPMAVELDKLPKKGRRKLVESSRELIDKLLHPLTLSAASATLLRRVNTLVAGKRRDSVEPMSPNPSAPHAQEPAVTLNARLLINMPMRRKGRDANDNVWKMIGIDSSGRMYFGNGTTHLVLRTITEVEDTFENVLAAVEA